MQLHTTVAGMAVLALLLLRPLGFLAAPQALRLFARARFGLALGIFCRSLARSLLR